MGIVVLIAALTVVYLFLVWRGYVAWQRHAFWEYTSIWEPGATDDVLFAILCGVVPFVWLFMLAEGAYRLPPIPAEAYQLRRPKKDIRQEKLDLARFVLARRLNRK